MRVSTENRDAPRSTLHEETWGIGLGDLDAGAKMRGTWTRTKMLAVVVGLMACDHGAGSKDSGSATEDSGTATEDSGTATEDSGTATEDSGTADESCVEQAQAPLSWEEATALESQFVYQGVDEPIALVLMFHGGGGSMEDHFERVDPARITAEALRRGMAVASLNSVAHLDPDAGNELQWEEGPIGSNPDLDETLEMIRKLSSADELDVVPEGTPIVLIGTSNGGSMASRVAQIPSLQVAVTAIYISNAQAFHESGAVWPPMVLIPGAQDPGLAQETNTQLSERIDDPSEALLVVNPAEPVTDALLTRVAGIDCELGMTIIEGMTASGWLDDAAMLSADPSADRSWADSLPTEAMAARPQLQDLLTEAYAGHAPSGDQNEIVFEFLESHL